MSSAGTYAAGSYGMRVDDSWPTTGIESSPYSRDKSAAEAILDEYEQRLGTAAIPIARMRPGFILQRAASGLLRYGLSDYVRMQWFRGGRFCRVIGACAFRWSTPLTVPRR